MPAGPVPVRRPPSEIDVPGLRRVVADLFVPRPWVYWTDFLLTWTIGSICFGLTQWVWFEAPAGLTVLGLPAMAFTALTYPVAVVAFYRAATFVHEVVHLPRQRFLAFRAVWNLLCGIPFLIPSFSYHTHLDHHRGRHYGTDRDGEYIALATRPPWGILLYLTQCLWLPVAAFLRYAVLAPIGWVVPPFRRLLLRRASSMVMDPLYERLPKDGDARWAFWAQEVACTAFLWGIFAAALLVKDRLPIPFLATGYLLSVGVLLLNHTRTLAAHRYASDGSEMSFGGQVLDSINLDPAASGLYELWAPVGTKYHALHHLFPGMPYHNLGTAHRRLMATIPADDPYRRTQSHAGPAFATLWRAAASHADRAGSNDADGARPFASST